VQVLGEPGGGFRDENEAIFDRRSLRIEPHNLVAFGLVARDTVTPVDDQFLDQLGAGSFVLDQYDAALNKLCCSRTTRLRSGYSSRLRSTLSK